MLLTDGAVALLHTPETDQRQFFLPLRSGSLPSCHWAALARRGRFLDRSNNAIIAVPRRKEREGERELEWEKRRARLKLSFYDELLAVGKSKSMIRSFRMLLIFV